MSFTFDGPNKLVILSAGTTEFTLMDLWSRWKDWVRAGNAQYLQAFDTVGGESIDLAAGTLVPLFLFVKNGWKLRPQELTHTLSVKEGTLVVEGGGDPFVNTLGSYIVRIKYSQPVQAIGYSTSGTSGPSSADIAAAVRAELTADFNAMIAQILTRHPANQIIPANVKQMNDTPVLGTGTVNDKWRG